MKEKVSLIGLTRLFGLALVITYHFSSETLPGGFLGVDVFFTFSGFLITALFARQYAETGGVELAAFYKRRFSRVFTPLFFALVLTAPFLFLLPADYLTGLPARAAAALGFVTNLYEIRAGGSYEAALLPGLYVHTWSLSAEFQLYLLWGAAVKICSAFKKQSTGAFRRVLFVLAFELMLISFLYAQIKYAGLAGAPSALYYSLTARAAPFFAGACLGAAAKLPPQTTAPAPSAYYGTAYSPSDKSRISSHFSHARRARALKALYGACSLLSVFFICVMARKTRFEAEFTYRGAFLLTALCSAALIASLLGLSRLSGKKEPRPAAVLIDLSYCVYLFHWPLLIVFSSAPAAGPKSAAFRGALALAFTLALSALTRYVYEPMFAPGGGKAKKAPRALNAAALCAALCAAAAFFALAGRAPLVSDLEKGFITGYMHAGADAVKAARAKARAAARPATEPPPARVPAAPPETDAETDAGAETETDAGAEEGAGKINDINDVLCGVTVIGDSVCLGAYNALSAQIPESAVDAEKSRQIWQGLELMRELALSGELAPIVVIALGANVNKNALEKLDEIALFLPEGHNLVVVTPYNGKAGTESITFKTAEHMREMPERFPFVTVADWAEAIDAHREYLGADLIHIGGYKEATKLYADCVKEAIVAAANTAPKGAGA